MSESVIDDSARQGRYAARVADAERRARGIAINYRVAVVGISASDVVEHAGGFLCDRALAGWEVTAFVADSSNSGPLKIIGTNAGDLDVGLALRNHSYPQALVVAGRLHDRDYRVRAVVLRTLNLGVTQVLFWGVPPAFEPTTGTQVNYRLSSAARLFKAHAMSAAHRAADDVSDQETFYALAN